MIEWVHKPAVVMMPNELCSRLLSRNATQARSHGFVQGLRPKSAGPMQPFMGPKLRVGGGLFRIKSLRRAFGCQRRLRRLLPRRQTNSTWYS